MLPSHTELAGTTDEWAWSLLTVSDASSNPDDEEAEALTMSCTISGVGLELPLWFPLRYK
jgi:hypothetical protein